ncbi:MAG TPA: tetratricopeptide repeat protein, partial [Prolixibacteraceae bacterium]
MKIHVKGEEAGRLGDYEEAIKCFDEVYQIRKKIYGDKSPRLVSSLNNLGIQYKKLQRLDKAIEIFKKAETICIEALGSDDPLLGAIYSNLGNIYRLTGDYNKALQYQQFASMIIMKDSVKFHDQFEALKYNLVETQLKLGMNVDAIRFAQKNLATTLPRLKPRMYDLIALAYRNEEKFDLSDKYYLMSIKNWVDLYGLANVELVDEYLAYSSFLMAQKNYDGALLYSSKAQSIVLKFYGEKSTAYAEVQSNFGDYYSMKNIESQKMEDFHNQRKTNLNQAIQYYQNAIVSLVDSFENKNPLEDPPLKNNIISEIQLVDVFKRKSVSMEKLGDIYLSEFDNKKAEKYFVASLSSLSRATQLIHRLRIGYENEDSKLFLAQNQESAFLSAIRISYKLYKQTQNQQYINIAFDFAERSKASNLIASIKDVKAKEFGGIPDSLLKREDYLKVNVTNYTSMLFEENHQQKPDSQRVNLYASKIFKLNEEYGRLIKYFESSYPQYYSFKYENKITGIKEVQSKLRTRDALIEFVVDEPASKMEEGELYRFVITSDVVDFTMEKIDSTYEQNIDFVHKFLTSPDYLLTKKRDFAHYSIAGYGLYDQLIKPVS